MSSPFSKTAKFSRVQSSLGERVKYCKPAKPLPLPIGNCMDKPAGISIHTPTLQVFPSKQVQKCPKTYEF